MSSSMLASTSWLMCPRVAAEIAWLISAAAFAGSVLNGAWATPAW